MSMFEVIKVLLSPWQNNPLHNTHKTESRCKEAGGGVRMGEGRNKALAS